LTVKIASVCGDVAITRVLDSKGLHLQLLACPAVLYANAIWCDFSNKCSCEATRNEQRSLQMRLDRDTLMSA